MLTKENKKKDQRFKNKYKMCCYIPVYLCYVSMCLYVYILFVYLYVYVSMYLCIYVFMYPWFMWLCGYVAMSLHGYMAILHFYYIIM